MSVRSWWWSGLSILGLGCSSQTTSYQVERGAGCLVLARHEKATSAITETRREFLHHEIAWCDGAGVFVLRKAGSFLIGKPAVHLTVSKPGHGVYAARMAHPHQTGPGRFVGGKFQLDPVTSWIEAKDALRTIQATSSVIDQECTDGKHDEKSCRALREHMQKWQAFLDKTYPHMLDPKLASSPRKTRHGVARVSSWPLLRGHQASIVKVAPQPEGGLVVLERGPNDELGLVWLGPAGSVAAQAALAGWISASVHSGPDGETLVTNGSELRRFSTTGRALGTIPLTPATPQGHRMVDLVARGDGWLLGLHANFGPPELHEVGPDGKRRGQRTLKELRELISLGVTSDGAVLVHGEQRVNFDYASEIAGMRKEDGAPRNLLRLAGLDEAQVAQVLLRGVDAVAIDGTGIWAYSMDRYLQVERSGVADRKRAMHQLLVRANLDGEVERVVDITDPELGPQRMHLVALPDRLLLHPLDRVSQTGVDLLEIQPDKLQAIPGGRAPASPRRDTAAESPTDAGP